MAHVKFQTFMHKFDSRISRFTGFDSKAQWQMVPEGGKRFLQLVAVGTRVGSVVSTNPAVATIRSADEVEYISGAENAYCIEGKRKGTAFVCVLNTKKRELMRLEISVKSLKLCKVKFFLIEDNAGNRTNSTAKDVEEWVEKANKRVFLRQANMKFVFQSVQPKKVDMDLGDPIDFVRLSMMPYAKREPDNEKWHAITEFGDVSRDMFNVFCVWDFTHSSEMDSEQADAFVQGKNRVTMEELKKRGRNWNMCIMKNSGKYEFRFFGAYIVFAHEAGHFLGIDHYEPDEIGRRFPLLRSDGIITPLLYKKDINTINP